MRKEILDCINKKIQDNKNKQDIEYKEQRKKELVEESVRKSLLKTIEKFFNGLPMNESYRINLTEPNDPNNPREVSRYPGSITYPSYTYLKSSFSQIGYDILDIEIRGYGSVSITGFNIMGNGYPYKPNINEYFLDDGYNRNTEHISWKLEQLQAFVSELDWFEEQIAKQYGCSNDKP